MSRSQPPAGQAGLKGDGYHLNSIITVSLAKDNVGLLSMVSLKNFKN